MRWGGGLRENVNYLWAYMGDGIIVEGSCVQGQGWVLGVWIKFAVWWMMMFLGW